MAVTWVFQNGHCLPCRKSSELGSRCRAPARTPRLQEYFLQQREHGLQGSRGAVLQNKARMLIRSLRCAGLGGLCTERPVGRPRSPTWKEEEKLSLSADDVILCVESSEDVTRTLLEERTSVKWRIRLQHAARAVFLGTTHEQTGKEVKNSISFSIASKRIKYSRVNVSADLPDLHSETYTAYGKK